jgi:hypothetical protein
MRKGVAPTGLVRFFELTPGLRPGLIYAVPTGLEHGCVMRKEFRD